MQPDDNISKMAAITVQCCNCVAKTDDTFQKRIVLLSDSTVLMLYPEGLTL